MSDPKKVKAGKLSKAQGQAFEKVVRKDLESKGWIVDRWSNNVEFFTKEGHDYEAGSYTTTIGKLVPSKVTWRRTPKGMFPLGLNSGFPDFIAFIKLGDDCFRLIGVEAKMDGVLDTNEKDKCKWLLETNKFSKILVARKTKVKNKIVVEYEDFEEIEKRRHR